MRNRVREQRTQRGLSQAELLPPAPATCCSPRIRLPRRSPGPGCPGGRLGPVPWIFFCEIAEPDPDRCHIDGSAVDEVALVIPGGHRPVLAQPAEGAPGGVALLVGRRVESGRAAALAAAAKPAADLVGGLGNGGLDAASSQAGADRLAGVCLIGKDPAGSGPWPPRPAAGDRETVQERDEGEGVVALPGAGHPGQRPATSIREQVNLAGQPAPGPAQRLPLLRPGRLGPRGRRILVIRFSPLCGPGRSAWPRPASPGRCRAPAHAGPRPRADAPGPPSRPPRPSTPSPLPHRTRHAARPGSSPMSHPLTSADAGYTRSSSSRTPLADRATGTPPGCGRKSRQSPSGDHATGRPAVDQRAGTPAGAPTPHQSGHGVSVGQAPY